MRDRDLQDAHRRGPGPPPDGQSRPLGQHVLVVPEAGDGCRYRVVAVEWPLHVPARDYFSMTDEADVQVHVLLEPYRDDQEENLCPPC